MIPPPIPPNEPERLRALHAHGLLDTLPEAGFDDITHLASTICGTPISLISLVDRDRQWFKSRHGLELAGTSREVSFCAHAINDPSEVMVVTAARADPRFADNSLVTGRPHIVFYAGVPLVGSEGHALGSLCVIDDKPRTPAPHQLEALRALARQTGHLLDLRRKTTLLEEHERILGQRNDELRQFANVLAHDMKEPLRMVTSFMDRLHRKLEGTMDEQATTYFDLARDGAVRLTAMVNDLLDFTLTANGDISPVPVDLHGVLDEIRADLGLVEKGTGVLTTVGHLPIIHGDRPPLARLLRNLVDNAIKFTKPDGTPCVRVEVVEEKEQWEIRVSDDGIGIPVNQQERVFEIFSRLHRDKDIPGTGMGLSICRKIAERHGGELWVDSEPGKGSTFHLTIARPGIT